MQNRRTPQFLTLMVKRPHLQLFLSWLHLRVMVPASWDPLPGGLESPPALWWPERERVRYPWEANIHPDNNLKIGRRKSLIFSNDEMHYINFSDFDVLALSKSKERTNEVRGVWTSTNLQTFGLLLILLWFGSPLLIFLQFGLLLILLRFGLLLICKRLGSC